MSTRAPPELPGLMAASVWMKFSKVLMPSWVRPSALTMPLVTVWPTPKGLPMASTGSPMTSASESPSVITGRSVRSTFRMARSVSGSVPITCAALLRPSVSRTSIWSASSITWLLVRMYPAGLTMTPEPRPVCGWSCAWSPKKKRNQGSLLCGWLIGALLVLMLTTAGEARRAALRKLGRAVVPGSTAGGGASRTGTTVGSTCRRSSQAGLSVATTNRTASSTVTDWAKISQSRFMSGAPEGRPCGRRVMLRGRIVLHMATAAGSSRRLDPRQSAQIDPRVQ